MRVERSSRGVLGPATAMTAAWISQALLLASLLLLTSPVASSYEESIEFLPSPMRRADSFAHPVPSYGAPHGEEEEKAVQGYLYYYSPQPYEEKNSFEYSSGLFFTLFLVPLVALLGISYAVPTTGFTIGLLGRSMEHGETPFIRDMRDAQERLQQMYFAVMGSEMCLRKIVCDLGAANNKVTDTYKNLVVRLLDLWTPKIYKSFTRDYKEGLMEDSCTRFSCESNLVRSENEIKKSF